MRRSSWAGAGSRRVSNSTPGTGRRSSAGASNLAYSGLRSGSSSGTEVTSGNELPLSPRVSFSKLPKVQQLLEKIPHPSSNEIHFMSLVSSGNLSAATEFLKGRHSRPSFDINETNFDGYTALHMAVNIQDLDMVKLLFAEMEAEIKLYDVFFYAIKEGDMAIVEEFVQFQIQRTRNSGENQIPLSPQDEEKAAIDELLELKNGTINSEFDLDITPLMLAAHCACYELIKYFFRAGERLEPISETDKNQKYGDLLSSYVRVHTFQALASPTYISFYCMEFVSVDPIFHSFQLIEELRSFAANEPEVRSEYEKLAVDLEEFARDLLGLCRTSDEVELILSQPAGYREKSGERYPRLAMAVELFQKQFVSHHHTQTVLRDQWLQGFERWRYFNAWRRFLEFILRTTTLPAISLYFCVQSNCMGPFKGIHKRLSAPVSYFMHDLASYLFFLGLLTAEAWFHDDYDPNDKSPPRGSIFHIIVEFWIVFFVIGQMMSTLSQVWTLGRSYLSQMWNIYEIVIQVLFVVSFSFGLEAWLEAPTLDGINEGEYGTRKYWNQYSPLLVAESFYVLGLTMTFGRVFRVLQLDSRLGPLQISLSKMLKSIAKAFPLYIIVIFSFATGMCMLYKACGDTVTFFDKEPEAEEITINSQAYTSFSSAMETLFWGLFGMASLDYTNVIHTHRLVDGEREENHHILTQSAGRVLYGIFQLFAIVILLNTIVAMMTGSTEAIFSNRDMEWKFGRTRVWLFYANGMKYPVPFNTFAIFRRICKKPDRFAEAYTSKHYRTNYSILIKDLIRRYFHAKEAIGLHDAATRDHVDKLREAVSHIKEIQKIVQKKKLVSGAVSRFMQFKKSTNRRAGDT